MQRLALNTAAALAVLAVLYLAWQLLGAVLLFLLSLGLAAALRPMTGSLARRGFPRILALIVAYLLVSAAVTLVAVAAAGPLVTQVQKLARDADDAYHTVITDWPEGDRVQRAIASRLPRPEDLYPALTGAEGTALMQKFLGATFGLFGLLVDLVIAVFLSAYWLIDRVHFERLWLSLLRVERRAPMRELWRAVEREVGAYIRSELVQSFAAGVLLWLGYWFLGQRYPVLLALIGAVAWLVPWIGVLIAVAAVSALSAPDILLGEGTALGTLLPAAVYTAVVLLFLERVVEPRLFDRRRYNSLITAMVIIGMAEVAGFFGLLLGPPLAAALQIVGHEWMRMRLAAAASSEPPSLESLRERLEQLQAELNRRKSPAPELVSVVSRLAALVEEAGPMAEPSPMSEMELTTDGADGHGYRSASDISERTGA